MHVEDLTIGEARKLVAMFAGSNVAAPQRPDTDHGLCILAADRGWVFVGQVTEQGDNFLLRDSRTVIRWGTTKGLEELAEKGPLTNTRLGDAATLRIVPRAAVKFIVACNVSAWAK